VTEEAQIACCNQFELSRSKIEVNYVNVYSSYKTKQDTLAYHVKLRQNSTKSFLDMIE